MNFAQTLTGVLVQLGWKVETQHDHGKTITRGISSPTNAQLRTTIIASAPDVIRTWDRWPEDKQVRGRDKLQAYIAEVLRNILPGMAIALHPDNWTPDA